MSTTKLTSSVTNAVRNDAWQAEQFMPEWAAERTDAVALTNGAAAAAFLGAGIGCTAFTLFVILNEAKEAMHNVLTLNNAVGPLSGKALYAIAVWLVSWGLLHLGLRKRQVNFSLVLGITTLLVALSLLGTFPPIFELFAAD